MRIIESMPQQRPQEKESILEMLARGLVGGASQSLGQGLGNLATQGLGMLMDPNMKTVDARSLEAMGLNPTQAKAIASVKNPAFQRDMVMAAQKQQADLQTQQQKQLQAQQFSKALEGILGTGVQGSPQKSAPLDTSELTVGQVNDLAKFAQKERLGAQAEMRGAWKETKDVRNEILQSADEAKKSLVRLARMKSLQGSLDHPATAKALDAFGLDFLLKPESQEFKKLSTDFLTGVSKMFGGRVSNYEVSRFLDRIPNLMQSKEGRDRVIRNLQAFYEADAKRASIMRDVIKENGGTPPMDLAEQVSEKMGPIITKLEEKFSFEEAPKSELKVGNRIAELPDPVSLKGKRIRDHQTGAILISDGTQWVPEKSAAPQPSPVTANPQTIKDQFPLMSGQTNYGEF
jgi:hypothetical protein